MAKLATQRIIFDLSKAVKDNDSNNINVINEESITQLIEAVVALSSDESVIVEYLEAKTIEDD